MNHEQIIRPWLLVCLRQFGVKQVYPYRLPDESTRPQEPYAVYTPLSSTPTQVGSEDLTADPSSGNTPTVRTLQEHETRFRIDYYQSPNGLYELASCAVATQQQKLRNIFLPECAFKESLGAEDESTFTAEKIEYHHSMVVVFREFVEANIADTNALVDDISLNLNSDHPTYDISRDGYSPE